MEFSKEEIKAISKGLQKDWRRVGDSSAFGGIFLNDAYPDTLLKIQHGAFGTYDNEVAKQFEAATAPDALYETPMVRDSAFFPDQGAEVPRAAGTNKIYPDAEGLSYIEMDKADFAETTPNAISKLAKSQALIDLYRKAGMSHNDVHGGNIKFNPATGKGVLLDFAFATSDRQVPEHGYMMRSPRTSQLQEAMRVTGNEGLLELWDEQNYELKQADMINSTPETRAAIIDHIKQGEEVASQLSTNIDPVFPDDKPLQPADKRYAITQSGVREWDPRLNSVMATPAKVNARRGFSVNTEAPRPNNIGGGIASMPLNILAQIPSPEVIRKAGDEGFKSALGQYGKEYLTGLVPGAGVAMVTNALPVIGPYALGVGGGMLIDNAAQSANEASRVITGETALSKLRQAIGTKKRTGYSGKGMGLEERLARDQAMIDTPPTVQRLGDNAVSQTRIPLNDMKPFQRNVARRLRMAADRLNPGKLEFGLTELLLGR